MSRTASAPDGCTGEQPAADHDVALREWAWRDEQRTLGEAHRSVPPLVGAR
ncbi:hypothetical protein [Streptomyces sp. NPDC048410]|uniref:hypothetical protein n=1 Tax=Streptomyces sp. NPDC048410 TaxID=3365545 RepID=UPI003723B911